MSYTPLSIHFARAFAPLLQVSYGSQTLTSCFFLFHILCLIQFALPFQVSIYHNFRVWRFLLLFLLLVLKLCTLYAGIEQIFGLKVVQITNARSDI